VNDAFLEHIREGKVSVIRGDTLSYTFEGLQVNARGRIEVFREDGKLHTGTYAPSHLPEVSPKHYRPSSHLPGRAYVDEGQGGRFTNTGEDGRKENIPADIVVIAAGFAQPPVDFLPKDLFPEGYERPNLYLQNFSTEDWSVVLTNSAYKNGIGSV
jgi:hypothetical protein